MDLPVTPKIVEAAYAYLLATPPFRRWRLPTPDRVRFIVRPLPDREGDHERLRGGLHVVRISAKRIGCTQSLMEIVGHEMVHMYQADRGVRADHNSEFHRLMRLAAKYHGWDAKRLSY